MPFVTNLFNPCLLPADSSLKSIFRRYFFKKRSTIIREHPQSSSTRQIRRKKGSDRVREMNSNGKFRSKSQTTNNYDMTILHDDELENTQLATVRRRKKKIPSWANHDTLQLAIINQVYFQDTTPEDIFGSICIEHVFDLFNSINVTNLGGTSMVVSRHLS